MTTNTFESWGIVEIMGHVRLAGKITEQVIAGASMLRVDVPKSPSREPFTKFYGSSAIYSITPTDEETALKAVIAFEVAPIQEYILRINSPALASKVDSSRVIIHGDEVEYDDYSDEPDEDDDDYGGDFGDDDYEDAEEDTHDTGWINVATPEEDDDVEDEPESPTLALKSIVRMERGETSNSKSPMWRCVTIDGERVNVFKHTDPQKDTFHFFAEAGYAEVMEAMKVDDVLTWKKFPISVGMQKKDNWWNVSQVYQRLPSDKPDAPEETPKMQAVRWAKELVDEDSFVVLDTETTGLNNFVKDEPVQICVLASDGTVLLDTLLKTEVEIERDAAAKHGITKEILAAAPSFAEVRDKLRAAIGDKRVIVYNADFDKGILRNANGDATWEFGDVWECAMEQYAQFWGDWSAFHGSYRWQSLTDACEQQGITGIQSPAHSALGDCLRTLALIKKMAAYEEPKTVEHPF